MDVRPSRLRSLRAWPVAVVACLLVAGLLTPGVTTAPASAGTCPPGYLPYTEYKASEARAMGAALGSPLAALADTAGEGLCISQKHPETHFELNRAFVENAATHLAPTGSVKAGAFKNALRERAAIASKTPPRAEWRNGWRKAGVGPLNSDEPEYGVSALGNGDVEGRISDFAWVPERKALYAAMATGGVWKSTNKGETWRSVGDRLPTQVIGSIAWSPVNGGTLYALSGDQSFGHYSYEGFGLFYTTNDGKSWRKARGVPDEAMGFKVTIDPTNPREIYAATGAGLYRSTDAGRSFVNVKLPTGPCAGKSNRAKGCVFANIVTDVIVQTPGGVTEVPGGRVVAAVGWRAGAQENPDGTVQSPNNGLYASDNGAPGTFEKLSQVGFAPQDNIGRVELGAAYGPEQDHNYLYAIVQDAALLRGPGTPTIDAPADPPPLPVGVPTVLNGIYVSSDFGETWQLMASGMELQSPHTGSALAVVAQALAGFGPGVQAWYNLFIQPDPTAATPGLGIPTRLIFGLEEVWQNEVPSPQNGKSSFKVIGRYFSGDTCLFISFNLPNDLPPPCPTDREDALESVNTPHPDQHQAVFIPEDDGGVTLIQGNDGGVYRQTVGPGGQFNNSQWDAHSNDGFNTLLPYHAVISKDGTVWMGLQDNGSAKITPKGKQIMTFGGDGHYVAVHPDNSKIAYSETPYGDMRATTDGGVTWSGMAPPFSDTKFNNPFVMDPRNPNHIVTAGRQVIETGSGPGTGSLDWKQSFDLGTQDHPGDPNAESSTEDPANSMTALDVIGPNVYVAFCSTCDVLNAPTKFKNGIATNVGGNKPPKSGSSQGWHFAPAKGLPNRYITGMAIDPRNPRTVYVTLGGYSRRWTPPGTLQNAGRVGKGHVYVSTDAGRTFRDVSGNLPDARAMWPELRGDQIIVGTDVGIFVKRRSERNWSLLGKGLPQVPIHTVELSPRDQNLLVAATHGRGVYLYRFGPPKPYGKKPVVFPKPGKIKDKVLAGPFTFETGDEGWTVASAGDHEWRRQPPGDQSAFSFAVMPYRDESSSILSSPEMTHPGGTVEVSWAELRDLEEGFDYMTIDWSPDGLVWHNAASVTGHNEGFPTFSRNAVKFWAPKGSLFVRFRVTSDQLVSFPANQGVAVDNVVVKY